MVGVILDVISPRGPLFIVVAPTVLKASSVFVNLKKLHPQFNSTPEIKISKWQISHSFEFILFNSGSEHSVEVNTF